MKQRLNICEQQQTQMICIIVIYILYLLFMWDIYIYVCVKCVCEIIKRTLLNTAARANYTLNRITLKLCRHCDYISNIGSKRMHTCDSNTTSPEQQLLQKTQLDASKHAVHEALLWLAKTRPGAHFCLSKLFAGGLSVVRRPKSSPIP